MSKPSSLPAKAGLSVGLEFDHLAIRAARLSHDGKGGVTIDSLVDHVGDFANDAEFISGLRLIREKLKMGARDSLVTCVGGKQVSTSQIGFRKLPPEEMPQALRLEMRKTIPFDLAGATLDYQILDGEDTKTDIVQVLVAVTAAGLISQHLKTLEKAGFHPAAIDVLPVATGNALWTWAGEANRETPMIALHLGPQISTIVVDGPKSPFFNRYIYFAAEDLVGMDPGLADKRVENLADEVARSLAFYEKSSVATIFRDLHLLGDFLEHSAIEEKIRKKTGLSIRKMDIPKKLGLPHRFPPGRFDLATSLAMRGGLER